MLHYYFPHAHALIYKGTLTWIAVQELTCKLQPKLAAKKNLKINAEEIYDLQFALHM